MAIFIKQYQDMKLSNNKRFIIPRGCRDNATKQFGVQLTTYHTTPCIRLISIEKINFITEFLIRKRIEVPSLEEYRELVDLLRAYSYSFVDIQNVDEQKRITIPIEALKQLDIQVGDTLSVLEDSKSLVLMKK